MNRGLGTAAPEIWKQKKYMGMQVLKLQIGTIYYIHLQSKIIVINVFKFKDFLCNGCVQVIVKVRQLGYSKYKKISNAKFFVFKYNTEFF